MITGSVAIGEIGERYDLALGLDDGSGSGVLMCGFVIPANGTWEEATALQDLQQLVSSSSPNITDRDLARWPRVSQGDWSNGERQVVFADPKRYYSSDGGIDVSKPGALQLLPATNPLNIGADGGTYHTVPVATDGRYLYFGEQQNPTYAANLQVRDIGAATYLGPYQVGGGGEIQDMVATPPFVYCGLAGGIWSVTHAGVSAQVTNDSIEPFPCQSMAYFKNNLYYITGGTRINCAVGGAAPGTTVLTAGNFEDAYTCLAATATGLLVATSHTLDPSAPGIYSPYTHLYTFDGTALSLVADLVGTVRYAYEMLGVTYILVSCFQQSGRTDYTLFSLNGATLAVVDDLRFALDDFRASDPSPAVTEKASLCGDGRNLFIAWPGLGGLRYDVVTGGISKIGGPGLAGQAGICAHRIIDTIGGLVDLSYASAPGLTVAIYDNKFVLPTGSLITSWFDFSTPALDKVFRSLEFHLARDSGTLGVEWQVDNSAFWTAVPVQQTTSAVWTCHLPVNLKAHQIRFRITLTADITTLAGPVIEYYAVKATLARTWKVTVGCRRNQRLLDGSTDIQGRSADKLALIQAIYANAGNAIAYVPSPGVAGGVERVNVILIEYSWASKSPSPRRDPETGVIDIEGDVSLQLTEQVSS